MRLILKYFDAQWRCQRRSSKQSWASARCVGTPFRPEASSRAIARRDAAHATCVHCGTRTCMSKRLALTRTLATGFVRQQPVNDGRRRSLLAMLGAGRTADLTEKSMELLGILVVVLWALPMYVAMGFDKDPGSTFTGVFLSNSAIAAEIYALSRLLSVLSGEGRFWVILCLPLLIGTYCGVWYVFSENFRRLLGSLLRRH